MSRLEELPDRVTDIEAGDVISYLDKEYLVKGVMLDSTDDPRHWRVVTENGAIPESEAELIHKRDRNEY